MSDAQATVCSRFNQTPHHSKTAVAPSALVARTRHQRVVAFETPETGLGGPLHAHSAAGKLIVVLTNEAYGNAVSNFSTTVGTTDGAYFWG